MPGGAHRIGGQQPTVEQDHHPARDPFDLSKHMRGDQYGAPSGQLPDQRTDLDHLIGVERIGRLVEDQQRRVIDQRLCDGDALAIAARELADRHTEHRPELQPLGSRADHAMLGSARHTFDRSHEVQELSDTHAVVEGCILRHIPDLPPRGERVRRHAPRSPRSRE